MIFAGSNFVNVQDLYIRANTPYPKKPPAPKQARELKPNIMPITTLAFPQRFQCSE
jgi:hypothetical protein